MKLLSADKFKACSTQLCTIRAQVRLASSRMGFAQADVNAITLAIDEACSNVIRYAYRGDNSGRIELDIYQSDSDAIFRLRDFAECIEESCLQVRKKSLHQPGGLGLQLMHTIMDSIELHQPDDCIGNILELKKKLPKG